MSVKLTKEQFLERCYNKHNDKYDYSLVEYINNKSKIKIVCKKHGEFSQSPDCHMLGQGCPVCRYDKVSDKRRMTLNEFLSKSKIKHGDKYDYSSVKWDNVKNGSSIITPICKKHGMFEQKIVNHVGGSGCKKCQYETVINFMKTERIGPKSSIRWNPNREQIKLNKKLRQKCHDFIYYILDRTSDKKQSKTFFILGYNYKDLNDKLIKDPNYDNWLKDSYNWNIDHIFPVKAFTDHNIYDPKIINSLDNLRIISKKENSKKNDLYDKLLFIHYLSNKGIINV